MKEYSYDITLSITVQAENEQEAKGNAISLFIEKYGQRTYEDVFDFSLLDTTDLEEAAYERTL